MARFVNAAKTDDTPVWQTGYHSIDWFDEASSIADERNAIAAAAIGVPPPHDVSATDGDFPDRVTVTWSDDPNAAGYRVYRSLVDDPDTADLLGSTGAGVATFDDPSGVEDQTYFYWVVAFDNVVI